MPQVNTTMSPLSNSAELLLKWAIYIYLAAFMPLIFVTPVVGTYLNSAFLFAIGNVGLLFTPFLLMILGQMVLYAVFLYVLSKYFARRVLTANNKFGWMYVALASLLAIDALPIFSAGYHVGMYRQYVEFFN